MATNKRDLRAYVRYDGTGRIIPGSLVLRRAKPKVGDWKEIQTYECCDGGGNCCSNETTVTLSFTPPTSGFSGIILRFFCDGTLITINFIDKITTNLTDTVVWLNAAYGDGDGGTFIPLVGQFSLDEDTIVLTMTECKKQTLCPTGELTFDIISAP